MKLTEFEYFDESQVITWFDLELNSTASYGSYWIIDLFFQGWSPVETLFQYWDELVIALNTDSLMEEVHLVVLDKTQVLS
jgi:hypothetical protein